jgi:hypothetical protein
MRLSLGNQTLALFASPFWGIYRLGRLSEHVILRLLNLGVVNIYLDFIWVLFRRFLYLRDGRLRILTDDIFWWDRSFGGSHG